MYVMIAVVNTSVGLVRVNIKHDTEPKAWNAAWRCLQSGLRVHSTIYAAHRIESVSVMTVEQWQQIESDSHEKAN